MPNDMSKATCFRGLLKILTPHRRSRSTFDDDGISSPSSDITLRDSPIEAPCNCGRLYAEKFAQAGVRPEKPPSYSCEDAEWNPTEVLHTIDSTIDALDAELRGLSLDIWKNPELAWEEHYAHDRLTEFMFQHGFKVTKHYLGLETAWRAEFSRGKGGRTIGLQSEMDALPNMGHACGHNLIAITGVGVALALKAALDEHDIDGTIVLLGTPAEEHGGGKIELLKRGAYKDMDVVVMAHPSPGPVHSTGIAPWIAVQNFEVEYTGHSAHAAYAPWEGFNAQDAAIAAYTQISLLRQQIKPGYRTHGVILGKEWEPNVIPAYAKLRWSTRAPTWSELEAFRERIERCFKGAAISTGCKMKITEGVGYMDCRQNSRLAAEYARIAGSRYGLATSMTNEVLQASTDFGNISYALPTIQPTFAIPVAAENGSNHTPNFAKSAGTQRAHNATITVCKCLSVTALRVLMDERFYSEIRNSFDVQRA